MTSIDDVLSSIARKMTIGQKRPECHKNYLATEELILYRISKRRADSGQSNDREKMADKLQNVFSMADYKLHMEIEQLEKEKRQCMNRLKEEKHMFKMSVKLPCKKGEWSYWSQYGERFHANGDLMSERGVLSANAPCSTHHVEGSE